MVWRNSSFLQLACPHANGFQSQTCGLEGAEGLEQEQAAEAQQSQVVSDSGIEQPEMVALAQHCLWPSVLSNRAEKPEPGCWGSVICEIFRGMMNFTAGPQADKQSVFSKPCAAWG